MRRTLIGLFAFLTAMLTVLVVPVYAAPAPEPEPVATSTDAVPLGSVTDPAPDAAVQEGTSDPVAGVPDTAPTLTLTRTDVAEFSLVGVTWAYDPAVSDTVTQVRVQDAAGTWGAWTEVLPETADQGPGADTGAELRSGTSPLWTGPSTGVEVELVTRTGAQPADVQLDLVDPGSSEADTALDAPAVTDTAHADTTMPPVFSRAQWGADESIRSWAPEYASTIKAATVHHTADSNDYTADQVPAIMRSIYRYHAVSLGWGDIGYNVIVDKFGRLWEGRAGGLERAAIGAHAGGFNTYTFGVSMLGNYDIAPVPQATVESVAAIIAWKFSLFGVNPAGTTVLTSSGGGTAKYGAGTPVTLPTIFAHRDVGSTVCPGVYGYARMGEIRDRVTALMGGPDGPPSPEIEARYNGDAGLRALLGSKIGGTRSQGDVAWQTYVNGRIYWSAVGGPHVLMGSILSTYLAASGPSTLGAPTTDELRTPDGVGRYNHFTGGGSVYWSAASGAHVVTGAVRARWAELGWELGVLGYPTGDTTCGLTGGGCRQEFQGGLLAWSPATGGHVVQGALRTRWAELARQDGTLGYPTAEPVCGLTAGGCLQVFQGGTLYWSSASGAHFVRGVISDTWGLLRWETGWLAYPTSDETCGLKGGGCFTHFQGGSVYWSPATGAHVVNVPVRDEWAANGWEAGALGYPVADVVCGLRDGGCLQQFQGGRVYWSPASAAAVSRPPVLDVWEKRSSQDGSLGYPVGDAVCGLRDGGCAEPFQNGWLFWSAASGGHAVLGDLGGAWFAAGAQDGRLGYPVGELLCGLRDGGCMQQFQGGRLYWSAASGAASTRGAALVVWERAGAQDGLYGYPVGEVACGLRDGGCAQPFQRAWLFWSPATGGHAVMGDLGGAWLVGGGQAGPLGYPVGEVLCGLRDGGCLQQFQDGRMYWSRAGGGHFVRGLVLGAWEATSAQDGALGYPTTDEVCGLSGGGCFNHFTGGSVYWSPAGGAHPVSGAIRDRWAAQGWETGGWGYPTGDPRPVSGGVSQRFAGGTATWNSATGVVGFG